MPYYPPDTLRYEPSPTDHNLLAWTAPATGVPAGTVMPTAGQLTFVKIKVPRPISVTNILMFCSTAGGTLTSGQCFAALYTGTTLIGQSADQAVAWATNGLKTMALAGGPYSLAVGNHYIAFWFNGTTGPTWGRFGALSFAQANVGLATPNLMCGTADAGVTTTAPSTMGAQTAASIEWWAAFS